MKILSESEIEVKLAKLQGWVFKENFLQKTYTFQNFREAISAMMRISFEAEEMNHHPNWSNVYNQLSISLSTHDAGGVTEKDFQLALRIDSALKMPTNN